MFEFSNLVKALAFRFGKWVGSVIGLLLIVSLSGRPMLADFGGQVEPDKAAILAALQAQGIDPDDLSLIQDNLAPLSVEQLTAIQGFLTNSTVIADRKWFDVSQYKSWDDYNFRRPIGDVVLSILARRDLFLDPARELNNRAITNMSPEALAALAFSQVYVEEKWDHVPPWDGDPNPYFNWIQPDLITTPGLPFLFSTDYLYRDRVNYQWETGWQILVKLSGNPILAHEDPDMLEALRDMRPPNPNVPRLAGFAYPLGNQLYLQTAETAYWYADYLKYGAARYGAFNPHPLDTRILFPEGSDEIYQAPLLTNLTLADQAILVDPVFSEYPGLWQLFHAPFANALRTELAQPEQTAFWDVMRFL